jgi:hypothetical protein
MFKVSSWAPDPLSRVPDPYPLKKFWILAGSGYTTLTSAGILSCHT